MWSPSTLVRILLHKRAVWSPSTPCQVKNRMAPTNKKSPKIVCLSPPVDSDGVGDQGVILKIFHIIRYVVVKIVVTISHRDLPVAKKNIFRPLRAIKIRPGSGPSGKVQNYYPGIVDSGEHQLNESEHIQSNFLLFKFFQLVSKLAFCKNKYSLQS